MEDAEIKTCSKCVFLRGVECLVTIARLRQEK